MLGHKLVQVLGREPGLEVFSTVRRKYSEVAGYAMLDRERTIENVDASDLLNLRDAIADLEPAVVINAIGVIKQLPNAEDASYLHKINTVLPRSLEMFSEGVGFRLISISTDCVFSGRRGMYTEDDVPDASDAYGISKLRGEPTGNRCLTLRTSIIGRELGTRHSFVEWFLSNRNGRVRGYKNAIYSGFPTIVFAELLADLIKRHQNLSGLYHVSSDPISKYALLHLVNEAFAANIQIEPDASVVMDRSLDSSRFRAATGFSPDPWPAMIEQMADDPTFYDEFYWSRT